jgi:uncharacterized membrane protein YfcA
MTLSISFLIILFLVALLYSIIGHGGASGYIALMVMFSVPFVSIKPTALILNIVVSFLGFIMYFKAGHFKWHLFYPLILASVPAAFLGGFLKFNQPVVNNILAVILLFSCYRLLIKRNIEDWENSRDIPVHYLLGIGALVGFLSGMLGIGGGIILSPLLILFKWTDARATAAISAPFIFLNSISGLIAFSVSGGSIPPNIFPLILVVVTGGLIGSTLGSKGFSLYGLRIVLALTVTFAAFKLFSI